MFMARPRKPSAELHCMPLKLWLTEDQEAALLRLSERRDVPKSIIAREALLMGLAAYLDSVRGQRAA
jgi:hypothetical protein